MVKKIIVGLVFLLLAINFVVAETVINVRTLPEHKVSIFIRAPDELPLVDSKHLNSGPTGEVSYSFTGSLNEIEISIKITKDAETIMLEELGTFATGSPLYLQVKPGEVLKDYKAAETPPEPETNETNITEAPPEPTPEVQAEEPTEVTQETEK